MNELQRNCERILRVYPASYRRHRGEEIIQTVMECTPPGRRYPPVAEIVALLGEGTRQRLGLAPAQPGGAVVDAMAAPFLAMAAILAAAALLFSEWDPWLTLPRPSHGFGPFYTDGVPMYLLVVAAGVAWACGRTRVSRWLVLSSWLVGAVIVALGHVSTSVGRPRLSFIVSILVLTVPAVIVTTASRCRSRRGLIHRTATAAAITDGIVVAAYGTFQASRAQVGPATFYWLTVPGLGLWVSAAAALALVACLVPLVTGGDMEAGLACAVSAMPWLVVTMAVAPDSLGRFGAGILLASFVLYALAVTVRSQAASHSART